MICYKDRAFCTAKCGNTECPRLLTPEVEADAARWWAGFKSQHPPPIDAYDHSARCAEFQPLMTET